MVVAKTDTNWADPNYVVRIEVATGQEPRVDVPPADNFEAIAYVPERRQVLLCRKRDDAAPGIKPKAGPVEAEHLLLDPETGEATVVQGEFWPFHQQSARPFQPTGRRPEAWVALAVDPQRLDSDTRVGRYSA